MAKKPKTDMLSVMAQIQEHLSMLDKKMDLVIEKTVLKAAPALQAPKPHQTSQAQNGNHEHHQQIRRERQLYEAICADCSKVCEVPFQPREDRPVYCKECFAARKSGNFKKPNIQNQTSGNAPVSEKPGELHVKSKSAAKPAKKAKKKKTK